jgi:hypothetical protein
MYAPVFFGDLGVCAPEHTVIRSHKCSLADRPFFRSKRIISYFAALEQFFKMSSAVRLMESINSGGLNTTT